MFFLYQIITPILKKIKLKNFKIIFCKIEKFNINTLSYFKLINNLKNIKIIITKL